MSDHKSLAEALAAFQAGLPTIGKDNKATVPGKDGKAGYTYRYADLASISQTVMPLMAKHGLSFSAKPTLDEAGRFVLEYALRHVSGEEDVGRFPLPSSGTMQGIGSAITYSRRYTLCSVLGIAPDEDDDGATAPDLDRRPVEHSEPVWDPVEQEALFSAWKDEIEKAKTAEEIADIGKRLLASKRGGELSPATYQKLAVLGAKRKAKLDQAAQAQEQAPVGGAPNLDSLPPGRRREMQALDRAAAAKRERSDGSAR